MNTRASWGARLGLAVGTLAVAGCAGAQASAPPPAHLSLSTSDVEAAVQRRGPALYSCHEAAGQPTATLVLDFQIAPSGQIAHLRLAARDGGTDAFGHCVVDALRSMRFARTRRGLRTNYTMEFREPRPRRRLNVVQAPASGVGGA